MKRLTMRRLAACLLAACLPLLAATPGNGDPLANSPIWQKVKRQDRSLESRSILNYAFQLCEHNAHLERLDELFRLAISMQDRNPDSPHFGNLRWSLKDGVVLDANAVEFCMENGSLIWRKHRDKLTPAQQELLLDLYKFAITGCMNHQVSPAYTNIAIMNFQNLILLGELFDRKDVLDEGKRRLDDFMIHTALNGISEYSSPTYTGVDLGCLHLLWQFTTSPDVRDKAERLLRLFWSDLAASAFIPAGRLAGTHSRDYDYLRGFGLVDAFLKGAGIIPTPDGKTPPQPGPWRNSSWRPGKDITGLATVTPRFVEQIWGDSRAQNRYLWAGQHIALGVSGACYHNMDIPLAVNFASDSPIPRGYFIADGRRDPYGKKVIPEGGAHMKTLHLKPFWAGVQKGQDALGLVVYRQQDILPTNPTLESHLVLPTGVDEILLNDEPIQLHRGQPLTRLLKPADILFVRSGGGAVGVRIPWSRNILGDNAQAALVWDDNPFGAFRLTIAHHDYWGAPASLQSLPGAALWLRVCDQADSPAAFRRFRRQFAEAPLTASVDGDGTLAVQVRGLDDELALSVAPPFVALASRRPTDTSPRPILAVNGRDLGRDILGDVPGVREHLAELERQRREARQNEVTLSSTTPTVWNAAATPILTQKMTIGKDTAADRGQFVWTPGKPGRRGGGPGSASWQIFVPSTGLYYLWAHVSTPTPDDDSFIVSITDLDQNPVLPRTDWPLVTTGGPWQWSSFPASAPTPIRLPKGRYLLTLHTREDGTKVDRLALTPSPDQP